MKNGCIRMKDGRMVVLALVLLGSCAGEAFGQAAAEAVLTHSASSAAGSSLGKTLGNALGNASSQLAGKLGRQTSTAPAVQRIPAAKKRPAAPSAASNRANAASTSSSGSLIASIEGGAAPSSLAPGNCSAAVKAADGNPSQSNPSPAATDPPSVPSAAKNCVATKDAEDHPGTVNLPAAK